MIRTGFGLIHWIIGIHLVWLGWRGFNCRPMGGKHDGKNDVYVWLVPLKHNKTFQKWRSVHFFKNFNINALLIFLYNIIILKVIWNVWDGQAAKYGSRDLKCRLIASRVGIWGHELHKNKMVSYFGYFWTHEFLTMLKIISFFYLIL